LTADVTPATRLLALLGDPVAHSLSPRFQNAAIAALDLDGVYVALRCDATDLSGLILGVARAGGGGNVTVPHKEVAARTVERATDAVRATSACNTFWYDGGTVWGDNTDVVGFAAAASGLLGSPPEGARVLLLGAGGAARAAVHALVTDRAGEIVILNRSGSRAEELAARAGSGRTRIVAVDGGSPELLAGEAFDLVVNATSLGLRSDDPLPLSPDVPLTIAAALDLVYRPGRTEWVRVCSERGIPAADGIEMLLHQGAEAFRRWWGMDPPIAAMRSAIDGPQPATS
jgi:shikimate dehydrogenase